MINGLVTAIALALSISSVNAETISTESVVTAGFPHVKVKPMEVTGFPHVKVKPVEVAGFPHVKVINSAVA